MRTLDLTGYEVSLDEPQPVKQPDGSVEMVETSTYNVRKSIGIVLFKERWELGPHEAIARDLLARRIEAHVEDSILLEEAEYQMIRGSLERMKGVGRADVPFISRILDAPEVNTAEPVN